MSIVVSHPDQVHSDPANSSPAKQRYSFAKEPRFVKSYKLSNPNPNKNLCYQYGAAYKKISTLSKQNGKFNGAARPNNIFVEINRGQMRTPAPAQYKIQSLFKDKKNFSILAEQNFSRTQGLASTGGRSVQRKKSNITTSFDAGISQMSGKHLGMSHDRISFGAPRECFRNVVGPNNFNYVPFKATEPGPGRYGTGGNPFRELGSTQVKQHRYTMAPKADFCHQRDEKHLYKVNATPGPGAYESLSPRVPTGVIKADINPSATMMSRIPNLKFPGPQDYGVDTKFMDDQSQFIDTKKKIQKGNRFSDSKRNVFVSKSFTPGPGAYQASSAFGHYMDKNAAFSALSVNANSPQLRPSLTSADRASKSTRDRYRDASGFPDQKSLTNRGKYANAGLQINPVGLRTTGGGVYGTQTYQQILNRGVVNLYNDSKSVKAKRIQSGKSKKSNKPGSGRASSGRRQNKLSQSVNNGRISNFAVNSMGRIQESGNPHDFNNMSLIDQMNIMQNQNQMHAKSKKKYKKKTIS